MYVSLAFTLRKQVSFDPNRTVSACFHGSQRVKGLLFCASHNIFFHQIMLIWRSLIDSTAWIAISTFSFHWQISKFKRTFWYTQPLGNSPKNESRCTQDRWIGRPIKVRKSKDDEVLNLDSQTHASALFLH